MELSFSTAELREICEKRENAVAVLGSQAAAELAQYLADIEALATVVELASMHAAIVNVRSNTELSLQLSTGHMVVFGSGHAKRASAKRGATDWGSVSRVRIMAIESANA